MSAITTPAGVLHYQAVGKGEPVILLHGWLNSWQVWRAAMPAMARILECRLYALDFWGFGNSAGSNGLGPAAFTLEAFARLVRHFLDYMGISRAHVIGHSMGGTVALRLALEHPCRLKSAALVCAPLAGHTMHPVLRLSGLSGLGRAVRRFPRLLGAAVHPLAGILMQWLLANESPVVRRMIRRDSQSASIESILQSISDLRNADLVPSLARLSVPALGIYGARDSIVSPANGSLLSRKAATSKVVMMGRSRHFPMVDEPDGFVQLLAAFLRCDGLNVEGWDRCAG